jgi:hypothetical protein
VVWDPRSGHLHDYGCQAAIRAGCIDLIGEEGIAPNFLAAQAAHILNVAFKTRLPLSEQAREFVQSACDRNQREELLRISERKLPATSGEVNSFLEALLSGAFDYGRSGQGSKLYR